MRRHEEGFTLIELTIVVIILGVLVTMAVGAFVSNTTRSARVACLSNQRILLGGLSQYQSLHAGAYPEDLTEIAPFVRTYARASTCPADGRDLSYDPSTGSITCTYPGHDR